MAMRILDTARRQWAVYWAPATLGTGGKQTYAAPVNLRVRWDRVTETFLNRVSGQEQRARSKVMLGEDVAEKGVLWLGPNNGLDADPVAGLTTPQKANPFLLTDAWVIARFDSIPIMRPRTAADFYRVAYL